MDNIDLENPQRREKRLRCACGKEGVTVWDVGGGAGPQLVSLTNAFHLETGRSHAPLIVCNACDSFQPVEA